MHPAVVATEDDEVVGFLLVSPEPERGLILRYRVRALRECPHLRIEIWGTRFCASVQIWATRPVRVPTLRNETAKNGAPQFLWVVEMRRLVTCPLAIRSIRLVKASCVGEPWVVVFA